MKLIKNCTIFIDEQPQKRDVILHDNKIFKISPKIKTQTNYEVINANGLYLLPSVIDLNVRVLNDSLNSKNLDALYKSAQKGGVGHFVLMSDFFPRIEQESFFEFLHDKKNSSLILSIKALKEDNSLNDIATLINNGAKVIQEISSINENLIRRVMQYSYMKSVPFFCFCDNLDLHDKGAMNEGELSFELGLPGISKISEISEVAKISVMAEYFKAKTLFQSISTNKSIDIINRARHDFKDIFCEVSIHHLVLNELSCRDFNTYAKINPPLRDEQERLKLIQSLKDDKIDTLTSLHSPKSILYKDTAFEDAKFGIDSIELFLPLCYTFLVKPGIIDMQKLIKLTSQNPAKIVGLQNVAKIKEGYDANLILFDPNHVETIDDKNSPYYGIEIYGRVVGSVQKIFHN